MAAPLGSPRCERARIRAALAPDGELSVLECRLLDTHVRRCAGCRRFAAEVAAIALQLRNAAPRNARREPAATGRPEPALR